MNSIFRYVKILYGRIVLIKDSASDKCLNDDCLNIQTYKLALEDNCSPSSTPIKIGISYFLKFSNKILCIKHDTHLHTYRLSDGQWYCTDCKDGCLEGKTILKFQQTQQTDMRSKDYCPRGFQYNI